MLILSLLNFGAIEVILMLRVWILWERSRAIGTLLIVVFILGLVLGLGLIHLNIQVANIFPRPLPYLISFLFSTHSHWHNSVSWHNLHSTSTADIHRPSARTILVGCPLLDYSGKAAYKGAYTYLMGGAMEVTASPSFSAAVDPREVHIVRAIDIEGVDGYCTIKSHHFRLN